MAARKFSRREFLRSAARAAALSAVAAAGAALSGGCAGPASWPKAVRPGSRTPAEIGLAASEEDVPDAQIERFNKEFAPYHVTRVTTGLERLAERLSAAPAEADPALSAIGVAVLPALKIPRLAQRGALRDISGLFGKTSSEDLFGVDGYFTSAGQRWGIALSWSPDYLVWANTQLWQAAGVDLPTAALSLEEWRHLSARLSSTQVEGLPVFGTDFTFDFPAVLWLAETLDPPARLFSADGRKLDLHSHPGFVQAVRFVLDWKKEGGIPFRRSTDPLKSNLPDCT